LLCRHAPPDKRAQECGTAQKIQSVWNRRRRRAFFRHARTFGQTKFRSNVVGNLLHYALVFLVVALIAAFFGFGGVAGTAMEGARILFWVAIVLFVVSLIGGLMRRA
jgi:uncharacterized membrane protein YtjA (UPF0391 family)